jgi:hypothetical protein
VQVLDNAEWLLLIDTQLEAPANAPVTLGQTAFGLLGVRMAKTIGVNDGGGTIRNSEGQVISAKLNPWASFETVRNILALEAIGTECIAAILHLIYLV